MLCAVGLAPPPGDPVSERRSSPPRPLLPPHASFHSSRAQLLHSCRWRLLWSQSLSGLAFLFSCCLIVSQYYYFFQRTLPPHDVPEWGVFIVLSFGSWDIHFRCSGTHLLTSLAVQGTAELSSNLFQMHPFLLSAFFASVLDMVSMVTQGCG